MESSDRAFTVFLYVASITFIMISILIAKVIIYGNV